ncbi:hypothetical protein, partial [Xenorhabdus sp. IM139775]|uniref:hypothetical protein n=1 Tax=Xenorhabdus sp. IM139775 TaxID=3025876 RepID=UPI0023595ABA
IIVERLEMSFRLSIEAAIFPTPIPLYLAAQLLTTMLANNKFFLLTLYHPYAKPSILPHCMYKQQSA